MRLSPRRLALAGAAILVLTLLATLVLRPGPTAQVENTFAAIQQAFEEGDARVLLDSVDRDYDFHANIPFLRERYGDLSSDSSEGESALRRQLRADMFRYFLFMKQRGGSHAFSYTVHEVSEEPPDRLIAEVTVGLDGKMLYRKLDPPVRHRFVLRSRGWLWPTATIVEHDPLPL